MEFTNHISKLGTVEEIVADLTQKAAGEYDLGLLFISSFSVEQVREVVTGIRQKMRIQNLIGCTCAGIIGDDAELENQPATTLILAKFPEAKVVPFLMSQSDLENINEPQGWYNFFDIYPNENPNFITLPDPFMFDMTKFLTDINEAYPDRPVMGGLASGALQPHENTIFLNDEFFDEGLVGVVLLGKLDITTIVSQGCRPIGETYIVTKAENNIIYELASRPLLDVLMEVLDKASAQEKLLAQDAIFVGLAMNEYKHKLKRGDFLIRALLGIDKNTGAGAIADYVEQGQTIQFHLRDAQSATEDLNELLSHENHVRGTTKPKGALVFCCNGRGEGLFRQKNHDIEIIQKYIGPVPAAGFFCAGEIGPVGNINFLHGFTNSIALFYAGNSAKSAPQPDPKG